jgi:hypothetical protein
MLHIHIGDVFMVLSFHVVLFIFINLFFTCGPGNSVGIATGYGLDGPGIECLLGRDFPHLSSPGAHLASCTM